MDRWVLVIRLFYGPALEDSIEYTLSLHAWDLQFCREFHRC